MEATLIELGYRWRDVGSMEFTWADLLSVVETLPANSPYYRSLMPKEWFWYDPVYEILAGVYDTTNYLAATAKKQQGVKRKDIPKPLPRPWDKKQETKKLGGEAVPLDDMRSALGW